MRRFPRTASSEADFSILRGTRQKQNNFYNFNALRHITNASNKHVRTWKVQEVF